MVNKLFDTLIKKNIRVISAFAGMGKTTLTTNDSEHFIDLESSVYHWQDCDSTTEEGKGSFKTPNPNWEKLYLTAIQKTLADNPDKIIFVCQTPSVRQELKNANIPFALAYPPLSMKEDFVARYKKRGNTDSFVALIEAHYEEWIEALNNDTDASEKLLVPTYLGDLFESDLLNK